MQRLMGAAIGLFLGISLGVLVVGFVAATIHNTTPSICVNGYDECVMR